MLEIIKNIQHVKKKNQQKKAYFILDAIERQLYRDQINSGIILVFINNFFVVKYEFSFNFRSAINSEQYFVKSYCKIVSNMCVTKLIIYVIKIKKKKETFPNPIDKFPKSIREGFRRSSAIVPAIKLP